MTSPPPNQITKQVMKDRADRLQWCEEGHHSTQETNPVYVQQSPAHLPKLVCLECSKQLAIEGWRILPM